MEVSYFETGILCSQPCWMASRFNKLEEGRKAGFVSVMTLSKKLKTFEISVALSKSFCYVQGMNIQ